MIVAEDMYKLGSQRSAIRELFEYGKSVQQRSAQRTSMISLWEIRPFRHQAV